MGEENMQRAVTSAEPNWRCFWRMWMALRYQKNKSELTSPSPRSLLEAVSWQSHGTGSLSLCLPVSPATVERPAGRVRGWGLLRCWRRERSRAALPQPVWKEEENCLARHLSLPPPGGAPACTCPAHTPEGSLVASLSLCALPTRPMLTTESCGPTLLALFGRETRLRLSVRATSLNLCLQI